MTWTSPNSPTITLAGFRSRCRIPRLCAYASVWHTCSNTATKRGKSSAGDRRCANRSARVRPLTSFMVKKGRPSSSRPMSWIGTTPGCCNWPQTCASSRKRRSISAWPQCSSRSTLTARDRPRAGSRPRNTSPIPPLPISSSSSQRPARAGRVRGDRAAGVWPSTGAVVWFGSRGEESAGSATGAVGVGRVSIASLLERAGKCGPTAPTTSHGRHAPSGWREGSRSMNTNTPVIPRWVPSRVSAASAAPQFTPS